MQEKERIQKIIEPLILWYHQNKKTHPWREGRSPYRIWVSEIMLQQTRTAAVVPYFLRFMEKYPTVETLAFADDDELMKMWEGLGYYSRARNLKKCARVIVENFGGEFPHDAKTLVTLPGIGPYTAGAISSIAFGEPSPAVDGNVLRVLMRLLASERDVADEKTKRYITDLLSSVYPTGARSSYFTEALMELGENVCIPNGVPHCDECPVSDLCFAKAGKIQTLLPIKSPKKARKILPRTLFVFTYDDKIFIRKRSPNGLLASLYEFAGTTGHLNEEEVREILSPLSGTPRICRMQDGVHIFTHLEWHMIAYKIELVAKEDAILLMENAFIGATLSEIRTKYSIPTAFKAFTTQLERTTDQ